MAAHPYHPGPHVGGTLQRGRCSRNAEEENTWGNKPVRDSFETVRRERMGAESIPAPHRDNPSYFAVDNNEVKGFVTVSAPTIEVNNKIRTSPPIAIVPVPLFPNLSLFSRWSFNSQMKVW